VSERMCRYDTLPSHRQQGIFHGFRRIFREREGFSEEGAFLVIGKLFFEDVLNGGWVSGKDLTRA